MSVCHVCAWCPQRPEEGPEFPEQKLTGGQEPPCWASSQVPWRSPHTLGPELLSALCFVSRVGGQAPSPRGRWRVTASSRFSLHHVGPRDGTWAVCLRGLCSLSPPLAPLLTEPPHTPFHLLFGRGSLQVPGAQRTQQPHDRFQPSGIPVAEVSDTRFWLPRAPGTRMVHMRMCRQNAYTH